MAFGADRILFSVDYPFSPNAPGRTLVDTAPLSPADLEKIALRERRATAEAQTGTP